MESLIVIVLFVVLIAFFSLIPKSKGKPKKFGKGLLITSSDNDFGKN